MTFTRIVLSFVVSSLAVTCSLAGAFADIDRRLFSGEITRGSGERGSHMVVQLLDDRNLIYCTDLFGGEKIHFRCEILPYTTPAEKLVRVDTLRGSADLKLFQDFGELQLFDVDGKTTNLRGELAPVSWCVPQISRRVKWIQYQGQSRKILHRRSDGIVEFNGGMMNIDRRPKFNGN